MHGSRSKITSKKSCLYIYKCVKFLALLGAPYIYDISRLRVNGKGVTYLFNDKIKFSGSIYFCNSVCDFYVLLFLKWFQIDASVPVALFTTNYE
jgi:hypothetical protein